MNSLDPLAILRVLDQTVEDFTFPMLDNGYFYLAASRLSLFRSTEDWAIVFQEFGFFPRSGQPSLTVVTIASRLGGSEDLGGSDDSVTQQPDEGGDMPAKRPRQWDIDFFILLQMETGSTRITLSNSALAAS